MNKYLMSLLMFSCSLNPNMFDRDRIKQEPIELTEEEKEQAINKWKQRSKQDCKITQIPKKLRKKLGI